MLRVSPRSRSKIDGVELLTVTGRSCLDLALRVAAAPSLAEATTWCQLEPQSSGPGHRAMVDLLWLKIAPRWMYGQHYCGCDEWIVDERWRSYVLSFTPYFLFSRRRLCLSSSINLLS